MLIFPTMHLRGGCRVRGRMKPEWKGQLIMPRFFNDGPKQPLTTQCNPRPILVRCSKRKCRIPINIISLEKEDRQEDCCHTQLSGTLRHQAPPQFCGASSVLCRALSKLCQHYLTSKGSEEKSKDTSTPRLLIPFQPSSPLLASLPRRRHPPSRGLETV